MVGETVEIKVGYLVETKAVMMAAERVAATAGLKAGGSAAWKGEQLANTQDPEKVAVQVLMSVQM